MSDGYWKAGGCSDGGCVFRAPGETGQHTNGGCKCLPLRMAPDERVQLRGWIRGVVAALAAAREEGRRDEQADVVAFLSRRMDRHLSCASTATDPTMAIIARSSALEASACAQLLTTGAHVGAAKETT